MIKFYKPYAVLKLTAYIILFSAGANHALAQGVTTATIIGKAIDAEGLEMPGASVGAFHEPTGTMYGITTRSDGRFNLPNLRIGGPYTITISFIGYEVQKVENVFLTLGETRSFEFQLKQSATELGEVVITGGGYDKDRTGASVAFDNNTIRKMPTITRSAADIYRLTPSSDGNSFAGRNDQFNNFSLNGAIFNNPFGLDAATPGGQTDAQPISLDAIDQIQVSVAPYDVTQAGFTGASINAVTKSGTNKFSGTAFSFYRTDALTGSKIKGEDVIVPDLTQLQSGFSIGGPIVKDKLFFFTNFELERRDDLGSAFVAKRGAQDGANESRVEASDLDAVGAALRSIGYEPGPYEGFTHETNNQKGIIKFDWNINKSHTLTAIYNFLDASKQKPANPLALGRRGPDQTTLQFYSAGYQINNKINSTILELKSILGNKFSNKLQVGYSVFDDSRDPFSTPFPVLNITQNGSRYIVAGHEPFSINNRLNQKVFQISDNFEIYTGDHTITVGSAFERFEFDNSFNLGVYEPFENSFAPPYNGNQEYYTGGTFSGAGFNSVQDFLDFVASGDMANIRNYSQSVFDANKWALAETNVGQWALYAQDKWAINDQFTLTAGIRMDLPLYFDTKKKIEENIERKGDTYNPDIQYYNENAEPVKLSSTDLPEEKPLFSPRIGFNYIFKGEQATVLRGGSGLFTGRFPFVWVGNQVANPDFFFYTTTDTDFKFPQIWRSNLGFDKNFGKGWKFSTDLIYSKDVNAMLVRNYGRSTPTGTLSGVDNRTVYADIDKSVNQFGGFTNAYVFTNTDIGRTINLTFELKRDWSKGLYTTLAYNFLDAQDASSIDAEISGDAYDRNPAFGNVNNPALAPSLFGNKHRVVGTANKTFIYGNGKHATTLSLFFEYAQGGRYSYTYSGDINEDGSGLNDLIYVPTQSDIAAMTFKAPTFPTDPSVEDQRAALEAYIIQDEYLNDRRGDYTEKYATLSPWYSRYDFRLLQDYKFNNGNSIQLSVDILNIGNFISSEWGVRQFPTNTQPISVENNPVNGKLILDANGNPVYSFSPSLKNTFTNDASLLSRWQMQFGLRYNF